MTIDIGCTFNLHLHISDFILDSCKFSVSPLHSFPFIILFFLTVSNLTNFQTAIMSFLSFRLDYSEPAENAKLEQSISIPEILQTGFAQPF